MINLLTCASARCITTTTLLVGLACLAGCGAEGQARHPFGDIEQPRSFPNLQACKDEASARDKWGNHRYYEFDCSEQFLGIETGLTVSFAEGRELRR